MTLIYYYYYYYRIIIIIHEFVQRTNSSKARVRGAGVARSRYMHIMWTTSSCRRSYEHSILVLRL